MRRSDLIVLSVIFLIAASGEVKAQKHPRQHHRPITVTVIRNLSFGAFTFGSTGGTVTISPDGSRSATGGIILLNLGYSFSTALYKITANQYTVISILNGPDVSLRGNNGGSFTLHIGDSDPPSPFVTTPDHHRATLLSIGGTLIVSNPALSPPGSYSGTFDIIFVQE